jgi:hypothetical protein
MALLGLSLWEKTMASKVFLNEWTMPQELTENNYSHVKPLTLNDKEYKWIVFLRCLGWFFFFTIFVNMGAPATVEEPKFPPPKTWNERHSHGWDEWHIEKNEAVPLIKWPSEEG